MPVALPPLVSLAVSLVPGLAKRVADRVLPGVEQKLSDTVSKVLGTDDVVVAEQKLQDPKIAGELRIRLAEIEVEADKVAAEAEAKRRSDELDRFRTEIADMQHARGSMLDLVRAESPMAWGPVAVSLVVVVGFFGTLIYLITLMRLTENQANTAVMQIVNIAVGALTAGFATVVSFWLGSSDGSRQKDRSTVQAQSVIAEAQAQSARTTREIVTEQTRQTAAILERVVTAAPAPPPPPAAAPVAAAPVTGLRPKDARQFGRCADLVFGHEGASVTGTGEGARNLGIPLKMLAAFRGVPATAESLQALTRDEAREILRANYWNALNCDNLPAGVDLVVFDFAVSVGPSVAGKLLQKVVHVEQDGEVGTITTGAARAIDAGHIVNVFSDGRLDFYRTLPDWEARKDALTRRTQEMREAALDMLRG